MGFGTSWRASHADHLRRINDPKTPGHLWKNLGEAAWMFRVADVFTKQKHSEVMSAIRSKGNKDTELKLASILRAHGIKGWRRHQPLPGEPDFMFRRERLAVFVDGCFWHGCSKHGRKPDSNKNYWNDKLARNRATDLKVSRELRLGRWRVFRFWGARFD